jgi:pimeloyl-ACP methyl ester carboxylesterase
MFWLGLRTRIGTRAMRRRAFVEMVMPAIYLEAHDRNRVAADLADVFGRDLADQPAIAMRQLRAMSRYDAGSRLAELAAIPTMVVSAEHDVIARPDSGRALAAAIPGATFVLMPDAGHAMPIQQGAAVNARLASHFRASAR